METVSFGTRSGFNVPRISMGAMRFPQDRNDAVALIRYAIDKGYRYIDTSFGYGDSEEKLAHALKEGYRDKVILSTKWSPWIKPMEDIAHLCVKDQVYEMITRSMKRLDVTHLDFYQVWNITNPDAYETTIKKDGFIEGVLKAKDEGLLSHIGITTHDAPEHIIRYLDEMEFCEVILVSYNMLSQRYAKVLRKAKEKGVGTIVMNPVAGGKLTETSPFFEPLIKELGANDLADLAIRYILANPDIDTLISGIAKTSDVNSVLASEKAPRLTEEECRHIEAYIAERSREEVGFCTSCAYCMPCPNEVNIPKVMGAIYDDRFLELPKAAKEAYARIERFSWIPGHDASACTECGVCVEKCTQGIDIPNEMVYAQEHLV